MICLTLEQLLEIHAIVVEATGGGTGLRDLGRLESAIATQTQNVFGQELYPTVVDKAAAVIRGIIADHPFVNGNKRTAMLSGLTLLDINSMVFRIQAGEIEDFAVEIATKQIDVPQISAWLKLHIV
jgi:death-on-curing protein